MQGDEPITRNELKAELRAERAEVQRAVSVAVQAAVKPLADALEAQLRGDFTDAQKRSLDDQIEGFVSGRAKVGWDRRSRVIAAVSVVAAIVAAGASVVIAALSVAG